MPIDTLHLPAALVLVDLQHGVTSLRTIHPADEIVANAARLAHTFRDLRLPVVRVRVAFSPDAGDVLTSPVDLAPPAMDFGQGFATYREEIGHGADDIDITKRGWDAFFGTELDLQLRRRNVRTIVLAGIRTCIGVESTARTGFLHGYQQVIAADAISDIAAEPHDASLTHVLPRLARIDSTDAIIAALRSQQAQCGIEAVTR